MIRLLLVDARGSARDVMSAVFRDELDMQMIGHARCVEEALAQLDGWDVVLISADLPRGGASSLVAEITRRRPGVKVLMMDVPDAHTGKAAYLAAGADDFVLEEEPVEELLRKVRVAVGAGQPALLAARR